MDQSREGGCTCGAVRYRFRGDPVALTACHCTECQTQSGSAFGMSLIVPRGSFELLQGELGTSSRSSDAGRPVDFAFCAACGTRIYHMPSALPKTLNIKPGTLDDTSWLSPAIHVWTRSKQPWVLIPEGVPSFEGNPRFDDDSSSRARSA